MIGKIGDHFDFGPVILICLGQGQKKREARRGGGGKVPSGNGEFVGDLSFCVLRSEGTRLGFRMPNTIIYWIVGHTVRCISLVA